MSVHVADAFFVLRAPRLPLLALEELRARAGAGEVRDALVAASPAFTAAAAAGDRSPAVEESLTRYLSRMSGRSTPRGLLASVSTGRVGERARLRLGEARPVSRLSAAAAASLAARMEADGALRTLIPFRPNPSLHEAERGRLHHLEARADGGNSTVAVGASQDLLATLERAREGATLPQLTQALVADGVEAADAEAFVDDLVRAQLLLSTLAVPATGPDPAAHLLERLRELVPHSALAGDLDELMTAIAASDHARPGAREATLARGRPAAERLGLPWAPQKIVQVDLVREAPELTLPVAVTWALLEGLDVLRRIDRATEPPDLAHFRDAFRRRYGQRRVSLLEALDPDAGIGFGAEAAILPTRPEGIAWGPPEQLMLRLVTEAAAAELREVDLASALPSLRERPAMPLPDSFEIMAALAAESDDAVTAGDYEVRLIGAFGPPGTRLSGRFCHVDAELRKHVEAHLRAEEALHPDAVFAEIAHVPAAGLGDLVSRPALRAHEIPLLTGAGGGTRIEPGELDLGLEDDELVLRDRGGRRIIPRLTNAHDVFGVHGLGLYRFLAQLPFQRLSTALAWSWGSLEGATFLPRVRLGKVVLSLARWRISAPELQRLREADAARRVAAVEQWRERVGCPRFVGLPRHESALPLDLDDAACVETLLREAAPEGHVAVHELWPAPERSPVTGPGGRYAHELLIPFISTREPTRDPVRPRTEPRLKRMLPPGSEWLFAKLYTSPAHADALIAHELAPVARAAVAAGAASRWHFLRYSDPEFHLRLRLQGEPDAIREHVLPAVADAAARLIEARRVQRFALDTYEREIERYGGDDGLLIAEQAFHHDSELVAALLAGLPHGEDGGRERWQLAAATTWSMLLALGPGEDAAAGLAARLRASFAAEQGLDRARVRQLARHLRTARPRIEALMDDPPRALQERDARLTDLGERLARLERAGRLERERALIVGDLAHMHCNRLLRASPRPQELRIHDALVRIAAGRAARERRRTGTR